MNTTQPVTLPDLPAKDWAESKYILRDDRTGSVTHVLACDGCGAHVSVTPQEYEKNDSTLCSVCAGSAH